MRLTPKQVEAFAKLALHNKNAVGSAATLEPGEGRAVKVQFDSGESCVIGGRGNVKRA